MKHDLFVAFKTLVIAGLLVVGASYASAVWTPAPASPPDCNNLAIPGCNPPINTGSAFQRKSGALDIDGVLSGSVAYLTSRLGIGTDSVSTGLRLDVAGRIGATAYCDQDGENCVTPNAMGGGTTVYACPTYADVNAGSYTCGHLHTCYGQLSTTKQTCTQSTGCWTSATRNCPAVGRIAPL